MKPWPALFGSIFLFASLSLAEVPKKINYQGYLTSSAGVPLSGTYSMVFALCDAATAGTCPWTETQSVAIDKGIFNVSLGAVTPLSLTFDSPYYLDIQVNGEQMNARQALTSVGYAFQADAATTAATATSFSGTLSGDVTGNQEATVVSTVGGQSAASVATAVTAVNNATSANTVDTLVKRDSLGSISTGSQTINAGAVGTAGLSITGASGQTANLQEWRNASNTLLGSVTPAGAFGINTATPPRASLDVGGTDGLLVTGATNSGTVRALGAGVRMHWYPRKGAFRAGMAETTYWDDNGTSYPNLALYSVGMGYQPRATAVASTAIGAYNNATGDYSLSLGSYSQATASHSVAIGTQAYATGIYSIAMGSGANTNGRDGAMVIGDDTYFQTAYASCPNQLTMRFSGFDGTTCNAGSCAGSAYRFWTSYPDCTSGVYMNHGQSGWSAYSSRTLKENFRTLDGEELLAKIRGMLIAEWNYVHDDQKIKYVGPVAEEFHDAFHLNEDDPVGINSVSIDGVNMAGVQALEKRTSDMKAEMAAMKSQFETQNTALQNQIELLKTEISLLKAQLPQK